MIFLAKFYASNIYDQVDGTKMRVRVQMWDMPGNVIMRPVITNWIQNSNAAVILFSLIDDGESFLEAKELVDLVLQTVKHKVTIILVGTKLDIIEESGKQIKMGEIEAFIAENQLLYCEISSKSGSGVEELFGFLMYEIKEQIRQEEKMDPPKWVPDKNCNKCKSCNSSWSVTNRRHHCRKCGDLFCGKCAFRFIPIPQIGKLTPTRVCNNCFEEIVNQK